MKDMIVRVDAFRNMGFSSLFGCIVMNTSREHAVEEETTGVQQDPTRADAATSSDRRHYNEYKPYFNIFT